MGIGKILGSISPAYGAITGKGLFGKGLAAIGDTGMGGLAAMQAKSARDKRRERMGEEAKMERDAEMRAKGNAMTGMAKGGSASKRADGCAIKGKTRGKMC